MRPYANVFTMVEDNVIMDLCYRLYFRLKHHRGDPHYQDSLLEKYNYFLTHSEHGADCTYSRKSKHLFMTEDWNEIAPLILSLSDLIKSRNTND